MLVSPGVAGFDRLRSSGLYLDIGGLKPPADVLVFSVLAGRSSSTFLAYDGRESRLSRSGQYPR